jgi:hypothetical protein
VNLQIRIGQGEIKHTSRREYVPYRPQTPTDPIVSVRSGNESSVVVRAHIVGYRGTNARNGAVTVEIDADQLPWLDGRVVSADDRTFVATLRTPHSNLQWRVDWSNGKPNPIHDDAYKHMLRLLGVEADIASVDVYVQPPAAMIRRLTLALAHVGERLEVQRTPLLPEYIGTNTVEGRVLGGTPDGDAVWVWTDGHVVEFSSPHLNPRATPDIANIGNLVGTRRESPLTSSAYDIQYTTPLIGTTSARIEHMRQSVPQSMQQVPGLLDIVASMLE